MLRLRRPSVPFDDAWQHVPVEPRRGAALGISFRTPQLAALGLAALLALAAPARPRQSQPYPYLGQVVLVAIGFAQTFDHRRFHEHVG